MARKITHEDFFLTETVQLIQMRMQMERDLEELRWVRWTGWEAEMLEEIKQ